MPEDNYLIFTKKAFAAQDGKVIPAVVYDKDGVRHVIGEATLHVDDTGLGARIKVGDTEITAVLENGNF